MKLAAIRPAVRAIESREITGTVRAVKGLVLSVEQLPLPVGSLVRVHVPHRTDAPRGEVVGFDGSRALVMLRGRYKLAAAQGNAAAASELLSMGLGSG